VGKLGGSLAKLMRNVLAENLASTSFPSGKVLNINAINEIYGVLRKINAKGYVTFSMIWNYLQTNLENSFCQ